jgi:integrase/recombinase XerD
MYVPIDIEKSVKKECKRRKYSDKTANTYWYCINRFLKQSGKTIDKISKKDVRLFLEYLSNRGRTGNTMNVYHMALRFLFHDVLDKRMWIDIHYSKVPVKMPLVLTKEEIRKLFNAIDNEKHKLIMQLIYAAGLRASELIHLKVKDIEFGKYYGFIRKGKGNKDRIFVVSSKIEQKLMKLIQKEELESDDFIFKSNRGNKYSLSSLQMIVKEATKKAGIEKKVHPHTLRHSFATHLVEDGYSLQDVQSMLGHRSPETSLVYVHMVSPKMVRIKSPFDTL